MYIYFNYGSQVIQEYVERMKEVSDRIYEIILALGVTNHYALQFEQSQFMLRINETEYHMMKHPNQLLSQLIQMEARFRYCIKMKWVLFKFKGWELGRREAHAQFIHRPHRRSVTAME